MNVAISFSGGKTSAFMAWWCKRNMPHNLQFVFANTGAEHEETLRFVDRCDKAFGLDLVWVEAEVDPEHGKGTRHRIVSFETASRNGEPFEAVIQKYGIPNMDYPHCTRELKLAPINSYLKEQWGSDYVTAIGIRVDEIDRMSADAEARRLIYPLVSMIPTDKAAVNRFWESHPLALKLDPLMGNCVWCWKKTLRKHLTIIDQHPEVYDFPERMERLYPDAGAGDASRVFFRQHRSVRDLREMAKKPFSRWMEEYNYDLFSEMDMPAGCSESCEI